MSKQEEANLILKLYELRREATLRTARNWYIMEFHPQSMADITNTMYSSNGAYLRMVMSYWEMAAALVNHGAVSLEVFNETNGEHFATYAKLEPFLAEMRTALGPTVFASLEKLMNATPGSKERLITMRERFKQIQSKMASSAAS